MMTMTTVTMAASTAVMMAASTALTPTVGLL
jgi:hypothetical protein